MCTSPTAHGTTAVTAQALPEPPHKTSCVNKVHDTGPVNGSATRSWNLCLVPSASLDGNMLAKAVKPAKSVHLAAWLLKEVQELFWLQASQNCSFALGAVEDRKPKANPEIAHATNSAHGAPLTSYAASSTPRNSVQQLPCVSPKVRLGSSHLPERTNSSDIIQIRQDPAKTPVSVPI